MEFSSMAVSFAAHFSSNLRALLTMFHITQADLELAMWLKLAYHLWSLCFHFHTAELRTRTPVAHSACGEPPQCWFPETPYQSRLRRQPIFLLSYYYIKANLYMLRVLGFIGFCDFMVGLNTKCTTDLYPHSLFFLLIATNRILSYPSEYVRSSDWFFSVVIQQHAKI